MKVSIVVVTLNEENNIASCIAALLDQNYKHPYEILIVDGGSTDRTHEIVKRLAKKYKNIKLSVKKKGSITQCRNIGIKKAKYDYIAYTDADCMPPKDWLKSMADGFKRIKKHDKKLAGVGGANIAPENPTTFQIAVGVAFNSLLGSLGSIQAKPVSRDTKLFSISCCNSFYKKKALKEVGMFSEELGNQGEDWDLGAKLNKKGKTVYGIPQSFVWHNWRATPVTFWKNMSYYGDGRMRLTKKHPDMIKVKYMLPLFFIPIFLVSLLLFIITRHPIVLLPFAYFPFIFFYSMIIAIQQRQGTLTFLVFVAFLVQHFGYSWGELKGLRWMA